MARDTLARWKTSTVALVTRASTVSRISFDGTE
jgi:hypothetical protein